MSHRYLKPIGFVRRQVALTFIWQGLAIALIAVIVGIPLGVALGRLSWRIFADNLGVVPVPVVVIASIGLVCVGTLVCAVLLAIWPAVVAARVSSNGLMRDER
jgi:ABC-type lipoprotein release transport system permease subunit